MSQPQKFSNSPVKASSIIGSNVVNRLGDGLGDIKEVVIDPRTGRVAYAVVSFGGFLTHLCHVAQQRYIKSFG